MTEKSGSVRTQRTRTQQTDSDSGWSGRWWRLKRSSTNWSSNFFSEWFGTGLEVILVLKRLDFSSTFVSRLLLRSVILSFSSINWSRLFLVQVRILFPVSGTDFEPKVKELVHSSWSFYFDHHYLLYIGLAIKLNITLYLLIISYHRLPSVRQLDSRLASKLTLKISSLLKAKKNIFRS